MTYDMSSEDRSLYSRWQTCRSCIEEQTSRRRSISLGWHFRDVRIDYQEGKSEGYIPDAALAALATACAWGNHFDYESVVCGVGKRYWYCSEM
jgi:hypothetical protein